MSMNVWRRKAGILRDRCLCQDKRPGPINLYPSPAGTTPIVRSPNDRTLGTGNEVCRCLTVVTLYRTAPHAYFFLNSQKNAHLYAKIAS